MYAVKRASCLSALEVWPQCNRDHGRYHEMLWREARCHAEWLAIMRFVSGPSTNRGVAAKAFQKFRIFTADGLFEEAFAFRCRFLVSGQNGWFQL